ncbi:TPA_exp: hypothetical protein A8136_1876 [Trichophyton benhamiae CBS 112371]|nr:TPA_exp: hypothetical protein A8136_1876 [Trichophyton benhamiae CBS 112371]
MRGLSNIGVSLIGIAGFSMLLGAKSPGVSNNTEGVYKRGVSLGFIIGWGNLNGVISSNIYRHQDAPNFFPGHGIVLGYLIVFLFGGSVLQHILLRIENGKRIRGERNAWVEGLDEYGIEMLGDKRPDFIYTL